MNIVKARARTVFYFNYEENSHKFYRVINFGPYTVFQYGRVGSAIGQYTAVTRHSDDYAAEAAANKKLNDKTGPRARDRYGNEQEVAFDIDLSRIREDKHSASQVIAVFDATSRNAAPIDDVPHEASDAPSAPDARDRITAFTQRALDVIELAVSQPAEALAAFADLNEGWASLQEEFARAEGYLKTADSMVTMA